MAVSDFNPAVPPPVPAVLADVDPTDAQAIVAAAIRQFGRKLGISCSFGGAGGMALALFGTTTAALPLLAWDATVELERCTSSALTVRAQQACADAFTRAVEERTGVPQLRP